MSRCKVQVRNNYLSFIVENAIDDIQIETVKSIFHFDKPLDAIGLHFAGTDLGPLFLEYEGTPLIKSFSLYGTLMKSIIHQQLNLSFSHTLTKRFVESFGERWMASGVIHPLSVLRRLTSQRFENCSLAHVRLNMSLACRKRLQRGRLTLSSSSKWMTMK